MKNEKGRENEFLNPTTILNLLANEEAQKISFITTLGTIPFFCE